jgi:glutamyl-tRNA synthetase
MRQERMDGIASKHRDDNVKDNLMHFEQMKAGTPEGRRWCIRAKISVDDNNKALRDPVIYRCNLLPHHRTGYVCLPIEISFDWMYLQRQVENISYI